MNRRMREARTSSESSVASPFWRGERVDAGLPSTLDPRIAVVGMAGRFPGAADVSAFWQNLCSGTESIRIFAADELDDAVSDKVRSSRAFVAARSVLNDVASFDAEFFGINASDARVMDPQHRFFLESCWEALEDAGYDPAIYPGRIGVYAGCALNTYFLANVLGNRDAIDAFTSDYPVGSYPELLGAANDFLATRVAYKLNLRGPAMTMQAGCSTSLLTIAQAAQTLLLGQADMMLAGGVAISFPQRRGYAHQEGGMVSADGHCRTFDARADGTVFGEGVGVVVLKRLDDAIASGDTIHAVIRGFGMNNDGQRKAGFTAPSVDGQADAIRSAWRMAGVEPGSIGYIECHGTATPLGDPIEVEALKVAFGAQGTAAPCVLGSVKPNVGHLDIASGVAGFIKATLAVRTGTIPGTLHFESLNPEIDIRDTRFTIRRETTSWDASYERRLAGVSAFGVGGSNVHLVLEDFEEAKSDAPPDRSPQIIVLSARTEASLARACRRLATALASRSDEDLRNIAFTLQSGRRAFAFRRAIVATSIEEAISKLEACAESPLVRASTRELEVTFMFPGQGSQYVGMGRDLYDTLPPFRKAIDACAEIVLPLAGIDIVALVCGLDGLDNEMLRSTDVAQPTLFALEYALATTLQAWNISPASMIGHSIGEFVAATLAGVLELADALALICARGRLMASLPAGAMLAVRLSETELAVYSDTSVEIAAVNAPGWCVLAGELEAIDRMRVRLDAAGVTSRLLHTSHAFHSAMMDPIIEPLAQHAREVTFAPPQIPYVSCVTGMWADASLVAAPDYWARHGRAPVRFADALATIVASETGALIEVGPGATLSTFARQGAATSALAVVRTLPTIEREKTDVVALFEAVARLWTLGARPNWEAMRGTGTYTRVSLPAYSFERTSHWVSAKATKTAEDSTRPKMTTAEAIVSDPDRHLAEIRAILVDMLEALSGEVLALADAGASFLELGFDSLFLGRFVQSIQKRFGVAVSFRDLLGELSSVLTLADFLGPHVPAALGTIPDALERPSSATPGGFDALVRAQMTTMQQVFRDQLAAIGRVAVADETIPATAPKVAPAGSILVSASQHGDVSEAPSRFDAFRVSGGRTTSPLTPAALAHIAELIAQTTARTPRSKLATARDRAVLADPRVAAGFRAEWKEMIYPITCARAKGSLLWDIDGNEYIDILNGFGQTAFGHAPDFVIEALRAQLDEGFAIGPQADRAGEAARLFCEMTGNERMTFCNTGSEAVMAALRVARTVTGRDRIVMFGGAYHGQFDEVLVKGSRRIEQTLPGAPGIPNSSIANVTVLPYATDEALAWVRENAHDLAAVVVEPVQSRHPALQPLAFLQELREITHASGSAFIFDEVVTGFRVHPGGMQAIFGIRADMATYGKVVGGGMPIGVLAGSARFLDALDGGMWQYGDASQPEVPPTFFAGTFVRHPLTLAAVVAVLKHLRDEGPKLQERLTAKTIELVERLNADLARRGIVSRIETFGSMFYFNFSSEEPLSSLLYFHLRNRGVYVQEGFPCFLTSAHSASDLDLVYDAFVASLDALQRANIFGSSPVTASVAASADIELTEEQKEVWLVAQAGDDASCAFNESVTIRFEGRLQPELLRTAWGIVAGRHEGLSATFAATGERMRFESTDRTDWSMVDLSSLDAMEAGRAFDAILERTASVPFDLVNGPLVRIEHVRFAGGDDAMVLTAHHLVCDGWSFNVIISELQEAYSSAVAGREPVFAPAVGYSTYARDQRCSDPGARSANENFWLAQYAEPPAVIGIPTDRPRPVSRSYAGATTSLKIERAKYTALKRAGGLENVTLFVVLLAAYEMLIGRLAGLNDVVVCVPAAGQARFEDAAIVGHCVNLLPIRASWAVAETLGDFIKTVGSRVLDAYEHQPYTFGTLVRQLEPARVTSRLPITEFQFNLERLTGGVTFGDVRASISANPKAFVNFDMFLNVSESADGLVFDVDYNTTLFDESTIQRWLRSYSEILEEFVRDRNLLVGDVLRDAVLTSPATLSGRTVARPNMTIHKLFEESVRATPEAIAVSFGERTLTFRDLDERANRMARYMRVRSLPDRQRIGICVTRSIEMLVAMLAVLKTGLAYVPLDPTHPAARLRSIVAEAELALLVVDQKVDERVGCLNLPMVDVRAEATMIEAGSEVAFEATDHVGSAAYLIYTSGSTGKPKGVEVSHAALVNLLLSVAEKPGLRNEDVLVAVSTISFDIAALELFLPLIVGARVVIASGDEVGDGYLLRTLLETQHATVLQGTPATWRLLHDAGFVAPSGFKILCGGEALPRSLADDLLASPGELWNMYGPTETTVWSTCTRVVAGDPITVGTPLDNTVCCVLDEADRVVETDVVGQLHIGGSGIANGYPYLPDLTRTKFVEIDGVGRFYRTGDAARIRRDGRIEILGRLDDQVKLHGYRIELGEIEASLTAIHGVNEAVVVMCGNDSESLRLVAYVVTAPTSQFDEDLVRTSLREVLPEYMVPKSFVALEAMPRNTNGKIDRHALPEPVQKRAATVTPPATILERQLLEIVVDVLGWSDIGTTTDFLALGADSLQIFKIVARANAVGLQLLAKDVLRKRTVRDVASGMTEPRGTAGQRLSKNPPTRLIPVRERRA